MLILVLVNITASHEVQRAWVRFHRIRTPKTHIARWQNSVVKGQLNGRQRVAVAHLKERDLRISGRDKASTDPAAITGSVPSVSRSSYRVLRRTSHGRRPIETLPSPRASGCFNAAVRRPVDISKYPKVRAWRRINASPTKRSTLLLRNATDRDFSARRRTTEQKKRKRGFLRQTNS